MYTKKIHYYRGGRGRKLSLRKAVCRIWLYFLCFMYTEREEERSIEAAMELELEMEIRE